MACFDYRGVEVVGCLDLGQGVQEVEVAAAHGDGVVDAAVAQVVLDDRALVKGLRDERKQALPHLIGVLAMRVH